MDRAMSGMCIGEKRKVVIPGALGFGDKGRDRDNIEKDQTLYYTVQLVDIFRAVPGKKWETEEGITIEVIMTHLSQSRFCSKLTQFPKRNVRNLSLETQFINSTFSTLKMEPLSIPPSPETLPLSSS